MSRIVFRNLVSWFFAHQLCLLIGTIVIASNSSTWADEIMATKAPAISYAEAGAFNWNGFYAGGHLGVAWGNSNWTTSTPGVPASSVSGSLNLFQQIDTFDEAGSFFAGLQAGYNYMLPNRFLIGAEVDASFPSFQNLAGISIGGTSTFTSPTLGPESYSETVLASGTVRGRVGYAPGHWLFYATGGFAWTYDQLTLTQLASGASESPFLWRLGWSAGAGVEVPVAPHWTARLEYLFTDYGISRVGFLGGAQRIESDFPLQELRAGLNYRFGNDATPPNLVTKAAATPDLDNINFHGQTTFVEQAYPAFRSPYEGVQSLPGSAQGRETWDMTLYAGVRLWKGAELVDRPRDRSGLWPGRHPRGSWISELRIVQARLRLPLRARATLLRPADDRSQRRTPRKWMPMSISSLAGKRRTDWCSRSASSRSSTYLIPTGTQIMVAAIS